ncbi:quinol:cytochrome C oxidoreductase [Winogradskyella sp. 3972H.M.0a.05]|uniref:quinol:cytochrome C oxidoreductase n=1 Tax=Winogradskyella sp. 3972H.M.0a.05 TaxID=2950277 RepID=UPI0033937F38
MYTFSNRLKIASIVLMVIGAVLWGTAYTSSHVTTQDVERILAEEAAGHHGGGHGEASDSHATESHGDDHAEATTHNVDSDHATDAHGDEHAEHVEHVLHQIHNRPYAALYVAAFFFFMISLGVLAFYGIQWAAQAGWSPVLFRVMEAITYYVLPGGLIVIAIAVWGDSHLFVWLKEGTTEPGHENYDALVAGKAGWLNKTGFIIRALIFLGGWSLYRYFARKFSLAQDSANDNRNFKKSFRIAAAFLVFYIYTESMMSWDWIMSIDPHWFSTLFGWYVFASMFVSGITVIALMTIYLKSKGYLEFVNDSHLHDLAKFMFAISIFWTYLWFSQFMLIWYADIPEEVTYFISRFNDYKLPFFGMLAMNFIFPLLVLMNSDYKRVNWFVVMAGIVILIGHYLDVFNMVMPGTVGDRWFIGMPEIGAVLLFAGLFLFLVFRALSKEALLPKGNPFIKESEHFHY